MSDTPLPSIIVHCPLCRHLARAAASLAGRLVCCPRCERRIQVPSADAPPPRLPEPSESCIGNVVSPYAR